MTSDVIAPDVGILSISVEYLTTMYQRPVQRCTCEEAERSLNANSSERYFRGACIANGYGNDMVNVKLSSATITVVGDNGDNRLFATNV